MATGLMAGKRGLIMGLANNRSIAWGIAKQLHAQGAEMAFSYQGEALKRRVEPLAAEVGSDFLVECDVTNDAAMDETFRQIKDKWGQLDFVVHAIGFSNKDELEGRYLDTSADNFALTMNISVYSFTAVAKRAEALMKPGGALLTLTYYGAVKYVPNYNVMGVAKAALEASVRWRSISARPASVSTPFRPAPSRPWPHRAFPACATCCTGRRPIRPCARMSRSMTWAARRHTCFPILRVASPAKSITLMRASTLSA
jgi:enoyl-[acyl-carrier protein] reductase I